MSERELPDTFVVLNERCGGVRHWLPLEEGQRVMAWWHAYGQQPASPARDGDMLLPISFTDIAGMPCVVGFGEIVSLWVSTPEARALHRAMNQKLDEERPKAWDE